MLDFTGIYILRVSPSSGLCLQHYSNEVGGDPHFE